MADEEKKLKWLLGAVQFADKVIVYTLKHKTLVCLSVPKRVANSLMEASTALEMAIAAVLEEEDATGNDRPN